MKLAEGISINRLESLADELLSKSEERPLWSRRTYHELTKELTEAIKICEVFPAKKNALESIMGELESHFVTMPGTGHQGNRMGGTERFVKVRKLLAEGGMAEVYQAKDKETGERVIWKQASPSRKIPALEANSALSNEIEVLERLDHPRIPDYIDSGFTENEEGDRVLVLIMESIDGGSLDDEMKLLIKMGSRQPLDRTIRIVVECCEALEYMADLDPPLYHRDIKPHNIIIEPSRGAILIDFGLAKEVAAGSGKSLSAGAHTAGWSPPERERAETGPTTDVYSLGQLLWHMLTNESAGIFSEAHKSEKIVECGHPEWLVGVVNQATIPDDPSKRVQSVAALRYMLENEGDLP